MADTITRKAIEKDSAELEALEAQAWNAQNSPNPQYAPPVFGKRIQFDDVILAARDGRIVGYAALGHRTPFESNRHIGVLRAIAVDPSCRRSGIGRRLLDEVEREAVTRGMRALRLTVMGSNQEALSLYVAAGYRELGRYPNEFRVGDAFVDDVFLGKALEA